MSKTPDAASPSAVLPLVEHFRSLCERLERPAPAEALEPLIQPYRLGLFRLVVVGEIKKGKSSFINALLDQYGLLPVQTDVATSVVCKILYGPKRQCKVFHYPELDAGGNPGQREPRLIDPSELPAYASEDGNPGNRKQVDFIGIELPHPLLKSGLMIVDTPGLGGLFKEHAEITWRFIPGADAVFFVFDSVETLAGQAEMDYLQRLRKHGVTVHFLQTKTDLENAEKWQQWQARNLEIIAKTLKVPRDTLHYFPLSAKLKQYATEDRSREDLIRSGFPAVVDFIQARMGDKQRERGEALLDGLATAAGQMHERYRQELAIFQTDSKEKLDDIQRRLETTRAEYEQWRGAGYQALRQSFLRAVEDIRTDGSNELGNILNPVPQAPLLQEILQQVDQQCRRASDIRDNAAAIQSLCIDICMNLLSEFHRRQEAHLASAARDAEAELGKTLPRSLRVPGQDTDVQPVPMMNLHQASFMQRFQAQSMGSTLGATLATTLGVMLGLATGGVGSLLLALGGALVGSRSMISGIDQREKTAAMQNLQGVLSGLVAQIRQQAVQQFQRYTTDYQRSVLDAMDYHVRELGEELQGRLKSLTEARQSHQQRAREQLQRLDTVCKHLDGLLQGVAKLRGR